MVMQILRAINKLWKEGYLLLCAGNSNNFTGFRIPAEFVLTPPFPHKAYAPILVTFKESLFFSTCNRHSVGIIKTRCILKVFTNLRLPYQTDCTRGLLNNAIDWLSSTHLQPRSKLNFQKTSITGSNYWNSSNCWTYLAATIEAWPAKCPTPTTETGNSFKT